MALELFDKSSPVVTLPCSMCGKPCHAAHLFQRPAVAEAGAVRGVVQLGGDVALLRAAVLAHQVGEAEGRLGTQGLGPPT